MSTPVLKLTCHNFIAVAGRMLSRAGNLLSHTRVRARAHVHVCVVRVGMCVSVCWEGGLGLF